MSLCAFLSYKIGKKKENNCLEITMIPLEKSLEIIVYFLK